MCFACVCVCVCLNVNICVKGQIASLVVPTSLNVRALMHAVIQVEREKNLQKDTFIFKLTLIFVKIM